MIDEPPLSPPAGQGAEQRAEQGAEQRAEQGAEQGAEPPQERAAVPAQSQPLTQATDQPTAQSAQPVEWEYREVVFRDYRGWRTRVVNGRELGNWKNSPTLIEYLEQAGKEGWELVSVSDRHNNQKEAYFKRPKR
jgi:hypothetical protein